MLSIRLFQSFPFEMVGHMVFQSDEIYDLRLNVAPPEIGNASARAWVMAEMIIGYFMKKYDIPGAPMVIGLILGPLLEQSLYRALSLAHGDITTLSPARFRPPFLGSQPSWPLRSYSSKSTGWNMLDAWYHVVHGKQSSHDWKLGSSRRNR
jgi:hypothetical protein